MLSLLRQRNTGSPHHEEGFTLVETMVALGIFVIGIIGCYRLQYQSTNSNAFANTVGTSATWATYAVEELLAKEYDDPDFNDDGAGGAGTAGLNATEANADGVLYIKPDGSTNPAAGVNDLYSVSWNIVEGSPDVLAGTKQVRVVVKKKGGTGSGTRIEIAGAPLEEGVIYTHDYFKTSATL